MVSLNTNVAMLQNYNCMRKVHFNIAEATERLSSGRQINRGADDPSGLGIATGMKAMLRGVRVSIENAQDAMNLVRVGDGGMAEISDMLQRMRDLALRSANEATLTTSDQQKLDDEYQTLFYELKRMSGSTQMKGITPIYWPDWGKVDVMYIFDTTGSMGPYIDSAKNQLTDFIDTLETAEIDWAIGLVDYKDEWFGEPTDFYNLSTDQGTVQTNVNNMSASGGWDLPESGLEALDQGMTDTSWRYTADTDNYYRHFIMVTDVDTPWDVNHTAAGDGRSVFDIAPIVAGLNADSIKTHVAGDMAQPHNIAIAGGTGGSLMDLFTNFEAELDAIADSIAGEFMQSEEMRTFDIHVSPTADNAITFTFEDCRGIFLGMNSNSNIRTTDAAHSAIDELDTAIDTLGEHRAKYGIVDVRLQKIVNDLEQYYIELSGAKSRIEDANMAVEVSKLTKSQVIEQSTLAGAAGAASMTTQASDLVGQITILEKGPFGG